MTDADYTQDEIRAVHAALLKPGQEFANFCLDRWKTTQPPSPPRPLYHYCSAATFYSIVTTGIVWASDIRFMNDASETTYAADLLKEAIDDEVKSIDRDDEREFMQRIARTFDLRDMLHVFAFCCSELDDSIPQWIAYGGRRGGIAVGLDLENHVLQVHSAEGHILSPTLVKVIYDPDTQRDLAKSMISRLLPLYRTAKEQFREPLWTFVKAQLCSIARNGLSNLLLTFKLPGFRHEQEWRLIVASVRSEAAPHYNVRPIGLVPYMQLRLTHRAGVYTGRLPISKVVQGPTSEPHLALEALRGFFKHLGFAHTDVIVSKMPLRY